jgi:hypothetical protein
LASAKFAEKVRLNIFKDVPPFIITATAVLAFYNKTRTHTKWCFVWMFLSMVEGKLRPWEKQKKTLFQNTIFLPLCRLTNTILNFKLESKVNLIHSIYRVAHEKGHILKINNFF